MKRLNLKFFRLKNNLTQQEMADKLDITKIHYCRIETGANDPSFGLMEKFEQEFEYDDMWELFKKEDVKQGSED